MANLVGLEKRFEDYAARLHELAVRCMKDPQEFVFAVHDGFIWGPAGSIFHNSDEKGWAAALLELGESLITMGITGSTIMETVGMLWGR